MIRANVLETLNEDYVRTARAKGAPESLRVMRLHVLRNALLPVVTMLDGHRLALEARSSPSRCSAFRDWARWRSRP